MELRDKKNQFSNHGRILEIDRGSHFSLPGDYWVLRESDPSQGEMWVEGGGVQGRWCAFGPHNITILFVQFFRGWEGQGKDDDDLGNGSAIGGGSRRAKLSVKEDRVEKQKTPRAILAFSKKLMVQRLFLEFMDLYGKMNSSETFLELMKDKDLNNRYLVLFSEFTLFLMILVNKGQQQQ